MSSFPGWYLLRWFFPPLSLASRTKAKASGNNSSSAVPLCARDFNSSVKAPVRGGNGFHGMERHGQLPEVGGFWPNRRIPWILFGVSFSNTMQIIQLIYLKADPADPTESWLVFFFFPFFPSFGVSGRVFFKQESPSGKQPTQKKHKKARLS